MSRSTFRRGGSRAAVVTCWLLCWGLVPVVSCTRAEKGHGEETGRPAPEAGPREDHWTVKRQSLVDELKRDGIVDPIVVAALEAVPRHEFVPEAERELAYQNYPLPIGHGQTISQPYIVGFMTQVAKLTRTSNVLEVGTGSGYQAAVLAEALGLGPSASRDEPHGALCSIEIIAPLGERARETLERLGYRDVAVRIGDGYRGWTERAPFDAILVTAAPDHVPQPLKEQLAVGGRLVIPVGEFYQDMLVITRTEDGYREDRVLPVRFVPMTGEAEGR